MNRRPLGLRRGQSLDEVMRAAQMLGNAGGWALLVLMGVWPLVTGDPVLLREFVYIGIFAIVAVGLNITLGYAGEFALGQAGVFAVGAYVAGILTAHHGWGFWPALLVAVAAATLVGVLVGLPGLRLGGWYFALMSLFVATVIPDLAKVIPQAGGDQGFGGIPLPSIAGHPLSMEQIYLLILVSVAATLILQRNIVHSRWGLAWLRMRQSNRAAEAAGISVLALKVGAYALASLLAGYAGALLPHVTGYLAPDAFPLSLSIQLIAAVTIGGTGSIAGPVIGMALLQWLPNQFSGFNQYGLLIYGLVLIFGMIFIRRGIVPTINDIWLGLFRRIATRRGWCATPATDRIEAAAPQVSADDELPPVQSAEPLTITGLSKHFGGIQALADVTLQARPGEITAVIGPNGSGKTTLLNSILGFYHPDAGEIRLGTHRLSRRPHLVARAGVARTFQTPMVMADSSCRDNVMSAAFVRREVTLLEVVFRLPRSRRDRRTQRAEADALLGFVGLAGHADDLAGTVPAGQQRLLDIARALAPGATVVLLDEPAAGLVGEEVDLLAAILRRLRDSGRVVVLVEHNVNLVMAVADHVVVLDQGAVIADGDPATVREDPVVVRSYLGVGADA